MTDEPEEDPGDMEEKGAEISDRIVRTTLEFFAVAKRIIEEQHKADGDEFNPDNEPSLQELVCVSQLIMNGSMAGVFRDPESARKSPMQSPASIINAVMKGLVPVLDAKIQSAITRERIGRPQVQAVPLPMPVPPPPPSLFDRVMDRLYLEMKECNCYAKGPNCAECEKRQTTISTVLEYMNKVVE